MYANISSADWDKRFTDNVHKWADNIILPLPEDVKNDLRYVQINEHSGLVIFKDTDRDETIRNVRQIISFIGDFDMLQIGKSLLGKLESMTEEAYNEISFDAAFEE